MNRFNFGGSIAGSIGTVTGGIVAVTRLSSKKNMNPTQKDMNDYNTKKIPQTEFLDQYTDSINNVVNDDGGNNDGI